MKRCLRNGLVFSGGSAPWFLSIMNVCRTPNQLVLHIVVRMLEFSFCCGKMHTLIAKSCVSLQDHG